MSYEPTKWQTGDIITLNKLNKLEQGVAAMMEEYEPTVWQIGDTVTSTKLNKLEQAVATLSESSDCGGGFEPKGMNYITIDNDILGTGPYGFNAGTNEPSIDDSAIAFNDANVCNVSDVTSIYLCGGLNVLAMLPIISSVDADSMGVFYDDASEVPSTKKVFSPSSGDRILFIAFKTPESSNGITEMLIRSESEGGIS